ncbi:MAG TPA: VOC family protein [Thermoanaerobaculia bacterium]|jgi:methylmalonyl-CoA/ethylmalonyl-CoA epimerase
MHIEKIGQIAIPVSDLDRAIAFYRDVLGLTFLFQAGPNLAFFDCGGVRILLNKPEYEGEFEKCTTVIYFSVRDLESSFAEVVERGAEATRKPHLVARLADREVWMGFFTDPDDNLLALMSEIPVWGGGSEPTRAG